MINTLPRYRMTCTPCEASSSIHLLLHTIKYPDQTKEESSPRDPLQQHRPEMHRPITRFQALQHATQGQGCL